MSRRATNSQLTAIIAVAESENFSVAARRLHLAQPTVHRAVRQVEDHAGRSLFDPTAQGVTPTRAERKLVPAARLALTELEQPESDVAALSGHEISRVVIGPMPFLRAVLLGPAIALFQERWKTLPIHMIEGPYTDLVHALRRGEIDMPVGALH